MSDEEGELPPVKVAPTPSAGATVTTVPSSLASTAPQAEGSPANTPLPKIPLAKRPPPSPAAQPSQPTPARSSPLHHSGPPSLPRSGQTPRLHNPHPPRRKMKGLCEMANFDILGDLGKGTYGVVRKARYRNSANDVVALKVFFLGPGEGEARTDFPITAIREIKILKKLRGCQGIVQLLDMAYSQAKVEVALVLEFMDYTLSHLLEDKRNSFPEPHVKSYMKQLFTGLTALERFQIVHRDLKSSNILVNLRNELKLADFGLSRFLPNKADTHSRPQPLTTKVCTMWYRAPELLLRTTEYTTAIDVWSAGCIFTEFYLREPLFKSTFDDNPAGQIQQLDRVAALCGIPNEDVWPGVSQLPDFNAISFSPGVHQRRIASRFGGKMTPSAIDLLDRLLSLDPSKRPTALGALEHPWFFEAPLPLDASRMRVSYSNDSPASLHGSPAVVAPPPPPPVMPMNAAYSRSIPLGMPHMYTDSGVAAGATATRTWQQQQQQQQQQQSEVPPPPPPATGSPYYSNRGGGYYGRDHRGSSGGRDSGGYYSRDSREADRGRDGRDGGRHGRDSGSYRDSDAYRGPPRDSGSYRGPSRDAGSYRGPDAGSYRGPDAGSYRGPGSYHGETRDSGSYRGPSSDSRNRAGYYRDDYRDDHRGREYYRDRDEGRDKRSRTDAADEGRDAKRGRSEGDADAPPPPPPSSNQPSEQQPYF